jgi:hypothetical protein
MLRAEGGAKSRPECDAQPSAASARPEGGTSSAAPIADESTTPKPPEPRRKERAQLKAFVDALPAPARPILGLLAQGLSSALSATIVLAQFAVYVTIWMSPVLLWGGRKWVSWYVGGYVRRAQRVLGWAGWLLKQLSRRSGGGAPPAA